MAAEASRTAPGSRRHAVAIGTSSSGAHGISRSANRTLSRNQNGRSPVIALRYRSRFSTPMNAQNGSAPQRPVTAAIHGTTMTAMIRTPGNDQEPLEVGEAPFPHQPDHARQRRQHERHRPLRQDAEAERDVHQQQPAPALLGMTLGEDETRERERHEQRQADVDEDPAREEHDTWRRGDDERRPEPVALRAQGAADRETPRGRSPSAGRSRWRCARRRPRCRTSDRGRRRSSSSGPACSAARRR